MQFEDHRISLGSLIAEARENNGLSIEDLSVSTNIRIPVLMEMELNNFNKCGGVAYARGHLRNIATKLGVEPQIFLTVFEEEYLQIDRTMRDLFIENSVARVPHPVRRVSWKVLTTISIALLLMAGFVQIVLSNS
jgi:cytoskeletal protein RodZ